MTITQDFKDFFKGNLLSKIPRLHLYAATLIGLLLSIQTILRIVFYIKFNDPLNPINSEDLLKAFYLGLKYDAQLCFIISLPLFITGWYKLFHPVYSHYGKKFWLIYSMLSFFTLLTFYTLNFGYYAYLGQGLDATALRFLENPVISAQMVWQSYPIIPGGIVVLILLTGAYFLFNYSFGKIDHTVRLQLNKKSKTILSVLTFILVFGGLFGKISWYPLRWSDAFFSSTHTFTSYLASNPVIYFFNTMKNAVETYDLQATKKYYPNMAEFLGVKNPNLEKLDYTRTISFKNKPENPPNVVVVILESFASYKTGLSGNPLNPTPNIDRLAKEGMYFKNFFTPSTGTARSVWTFITGIPDIEKKKTSSRNPLLVNQHTIVNEFKDYEKYYFLGGSASWANIRGLLSTNIDNLNIYEEGSYTEPRVDVWGISDLSLFREANKVIKKSDKPFFAIIQTSGNHRPYTIPEDNNNFKILTEQDLKYDVKEYGFQHLLELNSFRFMDHCVGEFIKMAKKEPYFKNTIFAFFGDHGIHYNAGKHSPASETQLDLASHRVPFVIYAPELIKGTEAKTTVASEVDVLPTLASLAKIDYKNTTLGRDLLNENYKDKRYAYTIVHGSRRIIGLLSETHKVQMKFDGSDASLYSLSSTNPTRNIAGKSPEVSDRMSHLTQTINESIRYIRENNKSTIKQ